MAGAFWRYLKHAFRQYGRDNCPQLAAAISYYALFSIVPLTFVVVSAFGIVIRSERLRAEVVQRVVDTVRLEKGNTQLVLDEGRLAQRFDQSQIAQLRAAVAGLSENERQALALDLKQKASARVGGQVLSDDEVMVRYKNSISDTLNSVASQSAQLTVFSLVVSAWSASAMFGAVRRALNAVWHVDYQRPYAQQKLLDLLMVFGFGGLMMASVIATGALRTLRAVSDEALGPLSNGTGLFWGALPYVLPGLVSFVVFGLLYRYVASVKVRFRDVWFGALVAALFFEVLKNAFAFYVANFNAYDLLYGSLGGILLFLSGVYFASAILLMGGELAAAQPGLGAGAFAAVTDPARPRPGLLREARTEGLKFLRSLFLPPRDDGKGHDGPDQDTRM
jgi:YihY family inner membrane protein